MLEKRIDHGVDFDALNVYMIGDKTCNQKSELYNIKRKSFNYIANIPCLKLRNFAISTLEDNILTFGGFDR